MLIIFLISALVLVGVPGFLIYRTIRNRNFLHRLTRQAKSYVPLAPSSPFYGSTGWFTLTIVIVNPFGGNGLNSSIYKVALAPMLEKAEVNHDAFFTERSRHAVDILFEADLSKYAAVAFLAGDTTFNEGVEGIFEKLGRDEGKFEAALKSLEFAILPGGTSNTMAVSLGLGSIFPAIQRLIEGRIRRCDVMKIITDGDGDLKRSPLAKWAKSNPAAAGDLQKDVVRYNPMSLGWGLVGNHDLYQEEKIRWMEQTLKSIAAPVLSILHNEKFRGKVSYLDPKTSTWVNVDQKDFIMVTVTNIPKVAADIALSSTLEPDDGLIQLDYIPGFASIPQLLGIFIAFDLQASHLEKYGERTYFSRSALEVKMECEDGMWTNAGQVMRNRRIHARVLPKAMNFIV